MNTKNKKYQQLTQVKERLEGVLKSFSSRRKKNASQNAIAATAIKPLIENALLAINQLLNSKLKRNQINSLLESIVIRTQVMMDRLFELREKHQKGSQVFEDLRIKMVVANHIILEMLPKGYTIQLCLLTPEEYLNESYQEPILESVKKTLNYWCAVVNTCWESVKDRVRKLFQTRWDVYVEKVKVNLSLKGFEGEQLALSF